ncbi:MAG: 2-oxoacid:ferredoxin oxidoreductase subunit beta [Leptospiraceae bacterium]|nr:2-oxoacid:ferredoxin oxidoreductase subunit beta [Leptospiraceae bacterium]
MGAPLTKQDFMSNQEVRWCPGCGDYAVLAAIQKTLPDLGISREKIVFISGIGCSSRFPYYMNTFGFHTIHGRAPALATGLALARPDLSIWVITGDGDALSIGGNHLIHAMRRNVNINILLFNNETYGLTKGQYSPTSHRDTISKSTPYGSLDEPFSAINVALGAGASFVARTYDRDQKHMGEIFKRATQHRGTSFVEIYQNCVIFNDGVHEETVGKNVRETNALFLKAGEPLTFGKDHAKGLCISHYQPEIKDVNADDADICVHREDLEHPAYASLLGSLRNPEYPEPMGVFRAINRAVYEDEVQKQMDQVIASKGSGSIQELLHHGETWEIR